MTSRTNNVPSPDTAREEAERLVAAGLAAVSMAADRLGAPSRERGGAAAAGFDALGDMLFGPSGNRQHTVANDSAACCRCPVCRVIAAAREPDPEVAERLATGAGDLAEGAARLLRTVVGEASPRRPAGARAPAAPPTDRPAAAAPGWSGGAPSGSRDPDDYWALATAEDDEERDGRDPDR